MNHTCLCLQFRLQLMGEPPLRCLTCQGKFGRAVAELRCNECVTLFRLQCLLVSDECPAEHIQLVYPEVRGAYLRALEVCDVQRRADQGGAAPPRAEGKSLPAREGQTLLLSSRAQPPLPPGALHLQPRTERRSVQTRTRPRTREKGAEAYGGRRSHLALRR